MEFRPGFRVHRDRWSRRLRAHERADKKEGIYLSFGEDEAFNEDRGWVTRHTQIQLKVFERLASA